MTMMMPMVLPLPRCTYMLQHILQLVVAAAAAAAISFRLASINKPSCCSRASVVSSSCCCSSCCLRCCAAVQPGETHAVYWPQQELPQQLQFVVGRSNSSSSSSSWSGPIIASEETAGRNWVAVFTREANKATQPGNKRRHLQRQTIKRQGDSKRKRQREIGQETNRDKRRNGNRDKQRRRHKERGRDRDRQINK